MLPGIGILPLQLMPLKALPRLSLAANVPAGRRESGRGRGVGVPSSHKVGPCGTQTPCHGRGRGVSHVTGPSGAILSGSPAAEPSLFLLLITSHPGLGFQTMSFWRRQSLYEILIVYTKEENPLCLKCGMLLLLSRCCCQVASVVSDSVQPHGLQPTRRLRPWDSPGKNTGVRCHFLLQLSR